jgi:hypothetical protein
MRVSYSYFVFSDLDSVYLENGSADGNEGPKLLSPPLHEKNLAAPMRVKIILIETT